MGRDDGVQPLTGDTVKARKPWSAPVLNEVEVAGNTYGPNNATYDDPSYNNSVS